MISRRKRQAERQRLIRERARTIALFESRDDLIEHIVYQYLWKQQNGSPLGRLYAIGPI